VFSILVHDKIDPLIWPAITNHNWLTIGAAPHGLTRNTNLKIVSMNWKRIILIIAIILVVIAGTAAIIFYPVYRFMFTQTQKNIDDNLTIVQGGGGNSGVLVADSAVVVIDTKMGGDAEKLFDLAKTKAGAKKIVVINTHYHGDHVKGNRLYKGSEIYIGAYDQKFLLNDIGPENMPNRFVRDSLILNLGNEMVCLYNLGQGHTWNDMVVLLKNKKVLFTGDLVFHNINPFLVKESGANVDKWIGTLDNMLKIHGVEMVVPGHGETGDTTMIVSMLNYFLDMKVAAADPSKETEMKLKYKSWLELPMMTSPGATISYIRKP
jgi:cyclase